MDFSWYSFVLGNRELLKIIYALIIIMICAFIVVRSDRFFRISMHKGIRYFRNAFLFFGIGFSIRYLAGAFFSYHVFSNRYSPIVNVLFEYFLVMAGFFLLYSLLWKRIEDEDEYYLTSLINRRILVFHIMAFVIIVLDYIWHTYYYMFISQIILFAFSSVISYSNYAKPDSQKKFSRFYFTAMILSFLAWSLNFLAAISFNWNPLVLINTYIINMVVFFLFLYGVMRVEKVK